MISYIKSAIVLRLTHEQIILIVLICLFIQLLPRGYSVIQIKLLKQILLSQSSYYCIFINFFDIILMNSSRSILTNYCTWTINLSLFQDLDFWFSVIKCNTYNNQVHFLTHILMNDCHGCNVVHAHIWWNTSLSRDKINKLRHFESN